MVLCTSCLFYLQKPVGLAISLFFDVIFNVFWNGSVTLRNFILLVISNMSFSNWSSLLQRGGALACFKAEVVVG